MRVLRSERGQALVELAVVLPVLFLILLGITEFGLAMNDQIVVAAAAREGARYAAISWEDEGWGCYSGVRDKVSRTLDAGGLSTAVPYDVVLEDLGDYVRVTVTYPHPVIVRHLGQPDFDLGPKIDLVSGSVFRKELSGP
ncbi:MAG: pilus assembly protein [Bacillota bacterium]|nr:pilus assembly protein [Bacillota bacterium]